MRDYNEEGEEKLSIHRISVEERLRRSPKACCVSCLSDDLLFLSEITNTLEKEFSILFLSEAASIAVATILSGSFLGVALSIGTYPYNNIFAGLGGFLLHVTCTFLYWKIFQLRQKRGIGSGIGVGIIEPPDDQCTRSRFNFVSSRFVLLTLPRIAAFVWVQVISFILGGFHGDDSSGTNQSNYASVFVTLLVSMAFCVILSLLEYTFVYVVYAPVFSFHDRVGASHQHPPPPLFSPVACSIPFGYR